MLSFQAYIMRRRRTDSIAGDLVEDIQTCIRCGKFPSEREVAVTGVEQLLRLILASGAPPRQEITTAARSVWRAYVKKSGDN